MSFSEQSKRAKAYNLNNRWKRNQISQSLDYRYNNADLSSDFLNGDRLSYLAERAYGSPKGYVISKNLKTGDVEMFVKGTSSGKEWLQNILESPLGYSYSTYGHYKSFEERRKYANALSAIAAENGVDIVYGHSRGAAIVGDMNGKFKKVGLDGATVLNRRGRNDYLNVRQKQIFDAGIGLNAGKTLKTRGYTPVYKYNKYHKVWSGLPGYR